jgi:hypothetical protein
MNLNEVKVNNPSLSAQNLIREKKVLERFIRRFD